MADQELSDEELTKEIETAESTIKSNIDKQIHMLDKIKFLIVFRVFWD